LSATNDAPGRHRRPLNPPGETAVSSSTGPSGSAGRAGTRATPETPGTDARQRGGAASRPESGSTPAKTGPKPAVVNAAAADPTARDSSPDFTRRVAAVTAAPMSSTAAAPAIAPRPPVSMVITPPPADPVSRIVSTLIDTVLSPFANHAPTAPVQSPADFILLAFARREFEQAVSTPSTRVNPPAGQITNGLVTDTVGSTPEAASTPADPDFISNTHNFGLFSITTAADPDDNYVAFVFSTLFFTNVLTSGTDPEDNLGFGAASIGVAGHTVNTFISPFLNFTLDIAIEDPFTELFTFLVRLGL
jgi:hypothetical protein